MNMEFNTINECKEKILSKKISILELNKIFIDRIKQQKGLNSFIYFDEDLITKRSNYLENLNDNNLSLRGIPLGIKDLFCTVDMPTTAGSKILSNFQPTYESFVTKKLLSQGSVFVGKDAGAAITTGIQNTCIGQDAGDTLTTGHRNIVVGYAADTTYTNSESTIKIGEQFTGNEANHTVSLGNDSGYIWNAFTTNATWAQVSDRRLKKNIEEDDLGLAFINALKPVTYNWKTNEEIDTEFFESKVHKGEKRNTETTMHGFIAQDVKSAMDSVGNTTFTGWWEDTGDGEGVGLTDFIMPLVKAIQELSAEVEQLKKQLKEK